MRDDRRVSAKRSHMAVPPSDPRQFAGAWWVVVLLGVLGAIAGVIVLAWPGISLVTLAWVSGIFLLVDGVFELVGAIGRQVEGRGMLALLGALSLIGGLLLVRHPIAGVVAIALLLGIWLLTLGLLRLFETFSRYARHRLWDLVVAALEIIAGVIIVSDASIGVATLALIVGIGFLLRGLGMAAAGVTLRQVGRR